MRPCASASWALIALGLGWRRLHHPPLRHLLVVTQAQAVQLHCVEHLVRPEVRDPLMAETRQAGRRSQYETPGQYVAGHVCRLPPVPDRRRRCRQQRLRRQPVPLAVLIDPPVRRQPIP